MYPRMSFGTGLDLMVLASITLFGAVLIGGSCGLANGYPASIESSEHFNKLAEKHSNQQESPGPILIGELKPNASDMEMILLRSKIANAILNMQETDKGPSSVQTSDQTGDCFIEVTKVERIPGKCHRVNNGLPICQSDNYMAINSDCS